VNDSVQPQLYRYRRTGGKKEKDLQLKFDWSHMLVNIDDKKHPWQLKVEANTLDKLVYQISLMRDLQSQQKQFVYLIADVGKLKTYHINILAEETITTPLGKIKTIRLTRERNKPKDRQTTLWCAPELHYLPVKLEHIEDGTRFTAMLKSLKGIDNPNAFTKTESISQNNPIGLP
jgi:hypothetical protein